VACNGQTGKDEVTASMTGMQIIQQAFDLIP
jgi:hypothetical protein